MSNQIQNPNDKKRYDLAERTSIFGKNIIEFVLLLPKSPINNPLISQIVRSATSIGANYMEADCAESKKDFCHKISICKKESKETIHWLNMLAVADPIDKQKYLIFRKEAHELLLIFFSILNNSRLFFIYFIWHLSFDIWILWLTKASCCPVCRAQENQHWWQN